MADFNNTLLSFLGPGSHRWGWWTRSSRVLLGHRGWREVSCCQSPPGGLAPADFQSSQQPPRAWTGVCFTGRKGLVWSLTSLSWVSHGLQPSIPQSAQSWKALPLQHQITCAVPVLDDRSVLSLSSVARPRPSQPHSTVRCSPAVFQLLFACCLGAQDFHQPQHSF